ncbi:MAG: hypothetical protein D084_Lepto4C00593G0002 [Leptospirillum sp. Group IV 'UBA BS']|nr:MAG: hypothetical protein D084_Lepto4C00593G0002 [Leptospirillum sp. Group IV 'UBA BS']
MVQSPVRNGKNLSHPCEGCKPSSQIGSQRGSIGHLVEPLGKTPEIIHKWNRLQRPHFKSL